MADLNNFIPLRIETLDTIIARMDADVNAGLEPTDDDFIDTTPGTFYADIRTAIALEMERLWDVATTDTVAASLVEYAWGTYLDAHAATLGLTRNDAVASTGELTFTGTNGTLISVGTEVSTIQTDPDEEPVSFVTTAGGTISGGTLTLAAEASESGAAGNVATGSATLLLSPVAGISAVTNSAAFTGGIDVESDEAFRNRIRLAWSAARGAGSIADYERWALGYAGVGYVRVAPLWNGPGTVRVVITDVDNNPLSATVVSEVQNLIDPFQADTAVNGVQTPTTTLTVDSTTGFASSGRIYVGTTLVSYTGVTGTTFTGCSGFSGSVADNTVVVQHGTGEGLAPVGAIVTVSTASTLTVNVEADIELEDNYSLTGEGGTIAVEGDITDVLTDYINTLPPGGDKPPTVDSGAGEILRNRIVSLILSVPGVYDVDLDSVELNGTDADLAVTALQVPEIGSVTLT